MFTLLTQIHKNHESAHVFSLFRICVNEHERFRRTYYVDVTEYRYIYIRIGVVHGSKQAASSAQRIRMRVRQTGRRPH